MFLKNTSALAALLLCLIPMQSFADDTSRNKEIAERFAKCDINRDGKLTLAEANGCMPRIYSNFSYIDSQNKGYVTVAEIEVMAAK
jgi:hypothetical protein